MIRVLLIQVPSSRHYSFFLRERMGKDAPLPDCYCTYSYLLAVRPRDPTEKMIEGTVFHHHDYDMFEAGLFRRRLK